MVDLCDLSHTKAHNHAVQGSLQHLATHSRAAALSHVKSGSAVWVKLGEHLNQLRQCINYCRVVIVRKVLAGDVSFSQPSLASISVHPIQRALVPYLESILYPTLYKSPPAARAATACDVPVEGVGH